LRDAPAAVVRNAEVADFPRADEIADRFYGFLDGCVRVVLVQVIDVDVIGFEALQAVVAGLQDPAPRESAVVRRLRHHVPDFGGQDPALAIRGDRGPYDLLRSSLGIDVSGVDEIDTRIECGRDDSLRGCCVGTVAEHHRAEADRGNLKAAVAEAAKLHRHGAYRACGRRIMLRQSVPARNQGAGRRGYNRSPFLQQSLLPCTSSSRTTARSRPAPSSPITTPRCRSRRRRANG